MLEKDRFGLSSEERESLAGQPRIEQQMDVKTSMLVFAGLLLMCALIIAASVIAPAQRAGEAPNTETIRSRESVEAISDEEQNQQAGEKRAEIDTRSPGEFPAANTSE